MKFSLNSSDVAMRGLGGGAEAQPNVKSWLRPCWIVVVVSAVLMFQFASDEGNFVIITGPNMVSIIDSLL